MDLHVHTCLSPCGDSSMVPPLIVERARAAGLDGIAICDHNSAANVPAVQAAGRKAGLAVLAGLELTTSEEIHLLAFFQSLQSLEAFAALVAGRLTGRNDVEAFGEQIVVDEQGRPLAREERLLIGAADLKAAEAVRAIHRLGGLAVASHADKAAFSIIAQLGFIPPELELDAVELSRHAGPAPLPAAQGLPVLRSSDAHFPEEIGAAWTRLLAQRATVSELGLALRGEAGRRLLGPDGGEE